MALMEGVNKKNIQCMLNIFFTFCLKKSNFFVGGGLSPPPPCEEKTNWRSNLQTFFISFFPILFLFELYSTIVFQIYFIICFLLSSYLYYDMAGPEKCQNIYNLNKYKTNIKIRKNNTTINLLIS